ncbi:hypothetical protein bcgnr5378_36910 [Bacillus cereus]
MLAKLRAKLIKYTTAIPNVATNTIDLNFSVVCISLVEYKINMTVKIDIVINIA